ncbi:uncharacterized protein LOC110110777, partial [Dendrobium catenatum]|uniref:uncharacterized protein LOC110110777 n=1 Tax=Dendrobium catenatum TaxID=906689 RepID=UPI0009F22AF1
MGFPQRFRSWVMSCITTPRFAILVNGTLKEGITAGCGFRQGCPLSPYLFILCSELLSLHFCQNYPELGVQIRVGGPAVSHLLYADDVLCFAGATIPNVRKLLKILDDYCGWTGQRINKNKSAILFSKKVTTSTRSRLARIAGCRKLSLAGRITICVDSAIDVCNDAHDDSSGVLADAERPCRSFLWDKDQNCKSVHYAAWGSLTRPRCLGGLSFHASSSWMGPLRARIAWDFINKHQNLFQRCMRHKYGAWPWRVEQRRGESNGWKIICNGAESLVGSLRWKVCNGEDIDMINHVWIQDYAICSWPTFCNIELAEGSRVEEFIMTDGEWDRDRLRLFFGESLAELICEVKIWSELHADTLELTKSTLGTSLSAICYNAEFTGEEDQVCIILDMHLRPRERVLWWRIFKDIIPTLTWLNRRGLGAGLSCPLGCNQHENLFHVTTQCLCGNRNATHHGKKVNSITGLAAMVLGSTSHGVFSNSLEQRFTLQSLGLFQNASWCPPPSGWLKINVD